MNDDFAVVCRLEQVEPVPGADKLDVLTLAWPAPAYDGLREASGRSVKVVTGKHYRVGQVGIYVAPDCMIPGWLAEDLWLFGTKKAHERWFEVRTVTLMGVESPGLFCGQVYRKAPDDPRSAELYEKRLQATLRRLPPELRDCARQHHLDLGDDRWIDWPWWRGHWKPGDVLDQYLGVVPCESVLPDAKGFWTPEDPPHDSW